MFVTSKDNTELVIQFRPKPLDMASFKIAKQASGKAVPAMEDKISGHTG
jgi:hypothetical protein